jgi:hypothetical protein
MATQATPRFDTLVNRTDDELKTQGISIARRMLKRKFASAYDDALGKIIKLQVKIDAMFTNIARTPEAGVEKFDVNTYLDYVSHMKQYKEMRDALKSEYAELFGEELPDM